MSILWALTGSMDPRLITDQRITDMAFDGYDTSLSSSSDTVSTTKRTAEVRLRGLINNQSFELIRRRGTKKQELYFSLNEQDLTTQSVKDTQNVIDRLLGVGNGLLQRCYFYGQHSHTSHSLLGLTDTRLKEEFSPLVNADIWVLAASESRGKERKLKAEITEIDVELRLRLKERERLNASIVRSSETLSKLQQSIAQTEQRKANETVVADIEAHALTIPANGSTSLEQQLNALAHNRKAFHIDVILPLRDNWKRSVQQQQQQLQQTTMAKTIRGNPSSAINVPSFAAVGPGLNSVDYQSQLHNVETQLVRATTNHTLAASEQQLLSERLQQDARLLETFQSVVLSALPSDAAVRFSATTTNNNNHATTDLSWLSQATEVLRNENESTQKQTVERLTRLGALDEQIQRLYRTTTSLEQAVDRLLFVTDVETTSSANVVCQHDAHSTAQSLSATTVDNHSCPTCGQPLPENLEQLSAQLDQLQTQLRDLLTDRLSLQYAHNSSERQQFNLQSAVVSIQEARSLQNAMNERQQQLCSLTNRVNELTSIIHSLQEEVQALQTGWQQSASQHKREEDDWLRQLQDAEAKYQQMQHDMDALQSQYRVLRNAEDRLRERDRVFEQELASLRETFKWQQADLINKQRELREADDVVNGLEATKKHNYQQALLHERLTQLFGSKGIQHYLFQSATGQLEVLANNALCLLTDGGVSLKLQSDAEQEKVIKTVLFKHPVDGQWRERALSQLSGGQWRRVSLALDLAFTELVRRRGVLRCNVMVMDEVLTHLDAQGREKVGSLLKPLILSTKGNNANDAIDLNKNSNNGDDDDDESNRYITREELIDAPFETILVILQDLAASELEEDFDSIDIVVKHNDCSRVVIDGEH
jgi:DNA repair exonuclease SbcCD ATPase subunit